MKKTEKKTGGDGVWFERGKHWCGYPIATGVTTRVRGAESVARRKLKRAYAKLARYGETANGSFKGWLRAGAA
jgi:hypothetical protein